MEQNTGDLSFADMSAKAVEWLTQELLAHPNPGPGGFYAITAASRLFLLYDDAPIDVVWLLSRCDVILPGPEVPGILNVWFGGDPTPEGTDPGCQVCLVMPGSGHEPKCQVFLYGKRLSDKFEMYSSDTPCERGWLLRLLEVWGLRIGIIK